MKELKYVITAVNQLTREREVVSKPHSRWKTEELLTGVRRDNRRHRDGRCYSLYRMEEYRDETKIASFAPPIKPSLGACKNCISVN